MIISKELKQKAFTQTYWVNKFNGTFFNIVHLQWKNEKVHKPRQDIALLELPRKNDRPDTSVNI